MKKFFTVAFFIILFSGIVNAATYYVDNSRPDDSGAGTSWVTAKKTIQAAIDAASDGDVVLVKYNSADSTIYSISASILISEKMMLSRIRVNV